MARGGQGPHRVFLGTVVVWWPSGVDYGCERDSRRLTCSPLGASLVFDDV